MADKSDISLIISADITSLEQAMEKSAALVNAKMAEIGNSVTSRLAGVAEAFAAAFAVKEILEFVNGVAEARAQLADFAEMSGTSVENLSKIQGIAKLTGTSMEDVTGALVKLTKGLATGDGEAGKAANALSYLGISARNADGSLRDAGDIYLEVSQKLAGFEDGAGKTALALDLFGKAGAAQLPLLKDLAANGDLVVKTTTEQAEQAKQYEQDLRRLSLALSANKKIIASEFIPVADDFVKALLDMIAGTGGLTTELKGLAADGSLKSFARDAATAAGFVIDAFDGVTRVFQLVGKGIGAVAAASVAFISGDFAAARSIMNSFDEDAQRIVDKPLFSTKLKAQFAASDAKAGEAKVEKPAVTYTGTGKKPKKEEDDSKALLAVQRAEFEAEANLAKEYATEDEQTNDDNYKHNLVSIEDYFTKKTALQQQGIAANIAAKESEIAAAEAGEKTAATERERLTIKATEIKLSGELAVLNAQYANVSIVNTRAMMDAERQRADGLKNLQIQSQVNVANAGVSQEKAALDQRKAMHQESDADAIQEEIGFENRLNEIQRNAIVQRIQMEAQGTNDPVKKAALYNELEALELQHQQKLTALSNEAVLERNKYALAAQDAIKDNFTSFFDDILNRTKSMKDAFKDLFKGIQKSVNDQLSKQLTDQLLGSGTKGGGMLGSILGSIFPGSPAKSPAAGPSGGSANDVAGLQALDAAAASTSTSLTGLQDTGIGGMLKGAKDWIAEQVLGKTATAAASTTQTTATTSMTAFVAAVNSATEALARMSASGSGGSVAGAANDIDFGNSDGGDWGALFDSVGSFAVGTDFVPQDMLAMIHKGERITPAKYNNNANGQNLTIHQTNTFPADQSRASVGQVAGMVAMRTSAAARRNN